MTKSEARLYLIALANGIDPITGEILPPDHLLHDESVAEALRTAIKSLEEVPPTDAPAGSGKTANSTPDAPGRMTTTASCCVSTGRMSPLRKSPAGCSAARGA